MVEFCEGTLDTMMERLCNSISSIDKGWVKRCIPATEEQIQQLQDFFAAYHYTIPSAYLQYLRVMGQNDRGLLQFGGGYDSDIDTVLDNLPDDNFEKGFFMFSQHWADPAFYLNLSSVKDNPIVTDDDKNYVAGSFEKLLFQIVFNMYQKTFKHYASYDGNACHEKKETEKCRECLYGMTTEERMNFMIQFVESYGVKKTWFSDQVHFYYYDMNYAMEIDIQDGYWVRFSYNDDKLFELVQGEFKKIGIYIYNQDKPEETPRLPDTGRKPEDFVPEGWKIVDHVELDYNADGMMDYVGVLEIDSSECRKYHRILFAITSNGTGEYHLDFQNSDLVQQGTVHHNEYLPLTAQGTSFTTHLHDCDCASWEYTYTYREGVWWLTSSESTARYPVICYYNDDWESGVGIRKWKSNAFSDETENVDKTDYDVVYELMLDEPLTLEQAGKRKLSAAHRVKDWKVASITFAAGVELPENMVDYPNEGHIQYCDENCVLYMFSDRNKNFDCLVLYCWQDKVLSVLAKEESRIGRSELYKGKIYYSIRIEGIVTYKTKWNEEQIEQEKDTVGFKLIRMNLDGTEKETIFEYRYQKAEQEIMEKNWGRYMVGWGYEISGDEIFIQIYLESEYPALFYRMKTDGSGLRMIGPVSTEL